MKNTFACDESVKMDIPISSLKDTQEGQLMPETFQCVYRDFYKNFVDKGKPQPLGAAQILAGLFVVILSLILSEQPYYDVFLTLPSLVFVVSGALSCAAGQFPNMRVVKVSFALNITSLFWSLVAIVFYKVLFLPYVHGPYSELHTGIFGLIVTLLIVETLIALFLIYWLSKAVFRGHFAHRTAETGGLNVKA